MTHESKPTTSRIYELQPGDIVGMTASPATTPLIVEHLGAGAKALVLCTNAGGGFPSEFNPGLEHLIQNGTTVVAVPESMKKGQGIVHFNGQPQIDAQALGVTYLERAGTADLTEVYEALKVAIESGLTGQALAEHIRSEFAYPPGERPEAPNPVDALQKFDESVKADGLGGIFRVE